MKLALALLFVLSLLSCNRTKNSENTDNNNALNFYRTVLFKGLERKYHLHLPLSHKDKQLPLVIGLHGGGQDGERAMNKLMRFNPIADREGFIVVYPDAVEHHWNDGRGVQKYRSHKENIDDVGFISVLIDDISKEYKVDSKRIYVTGASNGAMMSYRLGIELSDRITAIAAVVGNLTENLSSKTPIAQVSVMIINGTDDPLMPYNGGNVSFIGQPKLGKVISTPDTVKFWVTHNKCDSKPTITDEPDKNPQDGTRVKKEFYSNGKGIEVVLYKVEGGGHMWPGGYTGMGEQFMGKSSLDIDASELIWQFFKTHSKN